MNTNNNDIYSDPPQDELTRLISQQLGERKRKLDSLQAWEKQSAGLSVSMRTWSIWGTVAAACLLFVFVLRPFWNTTTSPLEELGIEPTPWESVRGEDDMQRAIFADLDAQRYDAAYNRIQSAQSASLSRLVEMNQQFERTEPGDEAILYEIEIELADSYELAWLEIYTLVRMERNADAIDLLYEYIEKKGDHRQDAKRLLKVLTEH